ncbi:protein sel-1 homolog 2 isoform X9 [Callorhinus ursinus]|uniref:protein sel-1 homolog 2 isoform X9 n=1 Tax=Callorhinus ursinus TaxID=34884 RepID=UPI003CD0522C
MKPLSLLIEILIILGVIIKNIEAEKHSKKQTERNATTQVSANELKQFLSHILERRKLIKVIYQRENALGKKKIQRKLRIKGIQNKDLSKRNKNHLRKQAKKNFTDEGDQLFKTGIKILQQSKNQKQKAEAYVFFAKAADMGNLKAMEKMADALLFGNFGMQNITAAIQLYESLAKEGSYKAQNALGFLSSYGIGMEYNQAKVSLGQLHLIGRKGLDQDYYKALYYFLKAAKAGSANAMAFIGKGNAIGLHGLGLLYFYGKGVPVNYAEALKYFQKAAEKGWPNAQFQLGFMYYSGSGVWKDYKLAFKYFYLASQSGQPLAIYYLAKMYATGRGVLRSCRTAVELYKGVCELGHWAEKFLTAYFAYKDGDIDSSLVQYALLAEMGYEVAQSNSAFILESKKAKILEKEKMYPMALLLWNRAAIQGNAFARVKIGDYHYYGYGTKKDYQTAATHYSIAADKYHSAQAMFNLAYMYEHGLGITKDIHLARRLYDMAAQSSPDAHIPVFFALMKLETVHLLRDILFFNQFTMRWKWMKLDNTLGPYWDLFVIGLIVAVLIFLLRNRYG